MRGESCRWYCGQHSQEIDYDEIAGTLAAMWNSTKESEAKDD